MLLRIIVRALRQEVETCVRRKSQIYNYWCSVHNNMYVLATKVAITKL